MWNSNWRERIWQSLDQPWDIIIVGGGITGAGLLREATQAGLHCLLVEAADFSFGTSSRSSKLVHGGFRYLRNKQYSVTRESVHEREWLLREAKNLVTPLAHLLPSYKRHSIPSWQLSLGVFIYDLFGHKWAHRALSAQQMLKINPLMETNGLMGGYEYYDAQVDDCRLVLRVLREAVRQGATALNYARAESLLRDEKGLVCGVRLIDTAGSNGRSAEVKAKVVINAAGPWCDELRTQLGAGRKIRKLRGSHLIFSCEKLPLTEAITFTHPKDHRTLFLLPWESVSMIGTTDVDHDPRLEEGGAEPYASAEEIDYMMEALHATLPGADVTKDDIISSFSGLRPIVFDGDVAPSKASRAHVILVEDGLLTITGGKLTIFRIMAHQALQAAAERLPKNTRLKRMPRFFDPIKVMDVVCESSLTNKQCLRLLGRYGADAAELLKSARAEDLSPVGDSNILWAELKFAARDEGVVHLDDLLLRRVRLGLLLPEGGKQFLTQIRAAVQPILGWDDTLWLDEERRYLETWQRYYSPAPTGLKAS
jgi:glycerol-3-phosphate dehydrogenase